MPWPIRWILLGALILICPKALCRAALVEDRFGRDISAHGITLIDWEGYMANPAIEFFFNPPPDAALPIRVSISAPESRLYFDLPSDAGPQGPRKQVSVQKAPQSISVGIFPARVKKPLETWLDMRFFDARGRGGQMRIPVHVIVSQEHDTSPVYPITVDFSQDKTDFYRDETHRAIFQQAVADWAFYLADISPKPVEAGAEKTYIFEPTGFIKSHLVTNANPYTGYLLYTYGIDGPEKRSGGEPSAAGALQIRDGKRLPIHRSGGVEVETRGNYNTLGWMPPITDQQWWKATNLGDVQNDLYSIVHHEMGHALFFNPANRKFSRNGTLKDDAVREYLGSDPKIDNSDHFDGSVDPASLHGAFGNEYHGRTPYGRWLITHLDLLCARAIGYELRNVDSIMPVEIVTDHLSPGTRGRAYQVNLTARGGIPFYDWSITDGKLPAGLSLDAFTGEIRGTPTQIGESQFTIRLRDYTANASGVNRPFTISVGK
jgi:hypothetical protein